ncbi:MAG: HAD family hydrolase [Rhodobacter sp.]|nr:HAD family hydrolase [Rhodobacter sp.]
MTALQALIVDVDGTLAETEEAHRHAFNQTFAAWGLPWHWDVDDYRQLLQITGGKERLGAFQQTLCLSDRRLTDTEIAHLHAQKTARYTAILAAGELPLRPGVADLIHTARAKGLQLAVATTTNRPNVDALCRCGWGRPAADLFEVIAAGDEVAAKKPAPDIYLLALDRLGLPADACLAVEDSRNGLLAAKAAGLRTIVAPSAYTASEDVSGADLIVSTLADPRVTARLAQ